jgi:putative peptidoglycan lipid II flippase
MQSITGRVPIRKIESNKPISMTDKPGASQEESRIFEQGEMTRAAGTIAAWTGLSRVMGFVRDMVIAMFMGAGGGADAFFVAFRIPNLLRRLFGEGALTAAFIPTFVETLHRDGKTEAFRVANVAMTAMVGLLGVTTALGIVFSPAIVAMIAPGFSEIPDKFSLTVELNRIMFPYIFFISLVALSSGILNSLGHFAAPAASPTLLNLAMITSVSLMTGVFGVEAYYALSVGVFCAGVIQLTAQAPFLMKRGFTPSFRFDFKHPAMVKIARLFGPAAMAGAVYQINVMIGTILASFLPQGSVSWLYYADRLVELPLGVFAIALGTAILPSMSRQAGKGDLAGLSESVAFAIRFIAFFIVPASFGLIILRTPIVAILFQRGAFAYEDTLATAYALLWYTVGLWAFSGLKVVNQAFFALKDTRTPLYVAIMAVVINLVAGLILMRYMAHGGLALATGVAAGANVGSLYIILRTRLPTLRGANLFIPVLRIVAASLLMGIVVWATGSLGRWESGLTVYNAGILTISILSGILTYVMAAYLLRCSELGSVKDLLVKRRAMG